ncbi:MAG: MBL fold metallo-hydrolase [Candidatus Aminicenantes bacterium]|nr:MBL fold metallo-hydrolase [Candidatus Aminicenantes bacterium]
MISRKRFDGFPVWFFFLYLATVHSSAQDFSKVEFQTVKVTEEVFFLAGGGGNIAVLIGNDGLFVVDTSFAELYEKVKAAIQKISDKSVKLVALTHQHYDHVNGNQDFAESGALICAHENVRKGMQIQWSFPGLPEIPPYPEVALPVLTFVDSISIHINDEEIRIFHLGPGHTTGDSIIHFIKANVIHVGDLYFNGGYPFIDVPHGGSIDGMIKSLGRVLSLINDDTKVIPGHGPLSNRAELKTYLTMLSTVRDRISDLIKEEKTLEEVLAAKPTAGFDRTPPAMMPPDFFVKLVYEDLSRE